MEKLLSIIIPTYNMEALLPRCLDSLVSARNSGRLEAMVVNDGSKDGSLAVARGYETKYPDVVTVIDKPNGNYGSTINAALPVAKGKFVKVLDSDDFFDTAALDALLEKLQEVGDVDMVHTVFSQLGPGNRKEVVRYNTFGKEPYRYGEVYDLDAILPDGYIRFFLMHALAYRTQMLRDIKYTQTEGISYTDTEWSCYPVYHARNIVFYDINLYQYNLDREGQTMAPEVLLKSVSQLEKVHDKLTEYYDLHYAGLSETRRSFIKQYMENRLRILYKIYLLDMPRDRFDKAAFERLYDKYSPAVQKYGWRVRLYPENKILRIDYVKYWQKHHERWPAWFECVNHLVDVVAKWAYRTFFRR